MNLKIITLSIIVAVGVVSISSVLSPQDVESANKFQIYAEKLEVDYCHLS